MGAQQDDERDDDEHESVKSSQKTQLLFFCDLEKQNWEKEDTHRTHVLELVSDFFQTLPIGRHFSSIALDALYVFRNCPACLITRLVTR